MERVKPGGRLSSRYVFFNLVHFYFIGCWSAGGRAARSPGVTTPHFVTSNKLGEKFQSPKPAHPPDYDSLIAKVSGDFGIKSAIVRAAKQDPEYKGVETLVVPLYIPKGAVPIRLARIPRSGGDNAKPQPSDPIGAFNRRTRLSSITSKRQGGPRRGSHPTPPPSYLRGWGRRILPKADARIGLQGDSEVSESQTLDLPELIRSKKNQNSRIVHFVKTTAADDLSSSTESTLRTSRPSTTTEVVQILQLRRGSTTKPVLPSDDISPSSGINGVENTSHSPTTDLFFSNTSVRIPIFNLKSIASSSSFRTSVINHQENNSSSAEKTTDQSDVKPQRRPLPLPKPMKEILRTSSSESSPASPAGEVDKNTNTSTNRNISESLLGWQAVSTNEQSTEGRGETQNKDNEKTLSNASKRRLPFPLRSPISNRSNPLNEEKNEKSRSSEIFSNFRLPINETKSSQNVSSTVEMIPSLNSSILNSSGELNLKSSFEINTATLDGSQSSSVPIPVRRRRPLRTKILLPDTENPPGFPSLSSISTTKASTLPLTRRPNSYFQSNASNNTIEIISSTTYPPASNIPGNSSAPVDGTSKAEKVDTNASVQSSGVRRIHDFFRMSLGRNKQDNINVTSSTETPYRYNPSKFHLRTTSRQPGIASTLGWPRHNGTDTSIISPPRASALTTPTPSFKTPADIVLAGFSDVMRASSSVSKDRFREITSNLDKLNKQLAEQGILIIHAEVEGKIIKLRNLTRSRNGTSIETYARPTILDSSDDYKETERESQQDQSLADAGDLSTTTFMPSDKLEYELALKDGNEVEKNNRHSLSSYYNINLRVPNDSLNEVSTTKQNKNQGDTTKKPELQSEEARIGTEKPEKFSSETEYFKATDLRSISVEVTSTALPPTELIDMNADLLVPSSSPPTPSLSSRIQQSSSQPTTRIPRIDNVVTEDEPSEENIKSGEEQNLLSALLKPRISNQTPPSIDGLSESKESLSGDEEIEDKVNHKQVMLIEELLFDEVKTENTAGSTSVYTEDSGGTSEGAAGSSSVYLVGMVGIFPLALVAAYVVRRFLRGDAHKKALPESEERPDGFTPPTHHVPRSHSMLPPLPELKLTSPLSSSTLTLPMGSDVASSHGLPNTQPSPTPWEFNRSQLKMVSILGEGNFGVVWKAEARGFCDYAAGGVLVAVKRVKEGAGAKEKQDLLRELSVMQLLGPHPNVVSLLGCCTQNEPHLVIMEYVMFGKLLTFLRDHRTRHNYFNFSSDTAALTSRDLTRFACQVATGCDYLQSRGVIHRDLAARNILVDHNKVCKIADFGMARCIQDIGSDIYEQKSKGALPIRWMAPESLYMNIFTHKSDVWSFGILCWEIVTLGATPYPGLTAREVMRQVTEGYRLERPDHCKPELYRLLATCWQQDLNKRPTFHHLKIELSTLLEHQTGYIDLENFPEDDYFSMQHNNDEKL
ncbi:flocculation protein FLO11-like [Hyalella azteca]|uniref:Flocculation protein FLO11-like n=1 Tax=Hyalella azteca TaxID=294128 RepID=A0A979FP47_HYAAZ|nr:flocculation protein FLO11-like [Hyalella azteca]